MSEVKPTYVPPGYRISFHKEDSMADNGKDQTAIGSGEKSKETPTKVAPPGVGLDGESNDRFAKSRR